MSSGKINQERNTINQKSKIYKITYKRTGSFRFILAQSFRLIFYNNHVMKTKLALATIGMFLSVAAFSQDSSLLKNSNKVTFKSDAHMHSTVISPLKSGPASPINEATYHDTRLGSSSPMYNTYRKNDYGAGSITNNPNKSGGESPAYVPPIADSTKK